MLPLALQRILLILGLLTAALFLGLQAGQGVWLLPVIALAVLGYYIAHEAGEICPETLVLGLLLAGYLLGNRGFAQLNLLGIFVGELALVSLVIFGLLHIPVRRSLPYGLDGLGAAILVFMAYGAGRLAFDLREYRLLAVRDYAMCYYAAFYFLAQSVARHGPSRAVFERVVALALLALLPLYLLYLGTGDWLYAHLRVAGNPLIFFKNDLVACYLGFGFFFFYGRWRQLASRASLLASGLCALGMLATTQRAVFPGLLLGLGLLALGGARRAWQVVAFSVLAALPAAAVFDLIAQDDFRQGHIYGVYEHVLSMVDFDNSFHYVNADAGNSGANNQFRLRWWELVAKQAWKTSPLFGVGFGADLSAEFVLNYFGVWENDDFTARSPHSFQVTVFARMGLVGVAVLLWILVMMVRGTLREVRASRVAGAPTAALPLWCGLWLYFSGASFGVVLEGPMGAIFFWTFLAFAAHGVRAAAATAPNVDALQAPTPSLEGRP